jgi:hypothetical protein
MRFSFAMFDFSESRSSRTAGFDNPFVARVSISQKPDARGQKHDPINPGIV